MPTSMKEAVLTGPLVVLQATGHRAPGTETGDEATTAAGCASSPVLACSGP